MNATGGHLVKSCTWLAGSHDNMVQTVRLILVQAFLVHIIRSFDANSLEELSSWMKLPLALVSHTAKTKYRKFETKISRKGFARPQSQFPHLCDCERFFPQDQSAYSADRSWEYINRFQTNVGGNWDWGRVIPFLGIHKWDFLCSARRIVTKLRHWTRNENSLNISPVYPKLCQHQPVYLSMHLYMDLKK
jgi:hypothetical protein